MTDQGSSPTDSRSSNQELAESGVELGHITSYMRAGYAGATQEVIG